MGYGAEPFVLLPSRHTSLVTLHAFYSVATASFTTFFTLARMSASLGRSMMSSSGTVMNFRLAPLVSEIKNMLFDGVTGITTCTAASTLLTRSRNFCFPSSSSLISPASSFFADNLHFARAVSEQLVHLLQNHLWPCQVHVSDPLPPDHAVPVNDINVRDEPAAAVELVRGLIRINEVGIGDLDRKLRQELRDRLLGITCRVHPHHRHILASGGLIDLLKVGALHKAGLTNMEQPQHDHFPFQCLKRDRLSGDRGQGERGSLLSDLKEARG